MPSYSINAKDDLIEKSIDHYNENIQNNGM